MSPNIDSSWAYSRRTQLTCDLAYQERIHFANKSEQFSAEQRELFEESWNTDTSAQEAEVEQLSTSHWYSMAPATRDFGYVPKVTMAEGLERLRGSLAG